MDLLPRVGGIDANAGGNRQGTGAFARKHKHGPRQEDEPAVAESAPTPRDLEIDPLLAELDRLRAMDPGLTDSGAHRAMKALQAYHGPLAEYLPGDAVAEEPPPIADAAVGKDDDDDEGQGSGPRVATPVGSPTGSDLAGP